MSLPVTDFIVQRLLEFDATYDVGSGVATTGLLIEPLSVVLQPIVDELTVVQATQSVLTILESSDPDSFAEDIVDAIASNVFVERDAGDIGSTVQRLRFFEPQAFSAPKGALVWLGPSGQRYANSDAVSVAKAEMALNQDGSLYYVDIPIIALEEGDTFNVDVGAIQDMEAQPIGVANTANLYKVADGRDRETNTELIDRIKVAVTFIIGGWLPSTVDASAVGSLLVGEVDAEGRLIYRGSVAGFDRAAEAAMRGAFLPARQEQNPFAVGKLPRASRFLLPRVSVDVTFQEITNDGQLRHPQFVGFRLDPPERTEG